MADNSEIELVVEVDVNKANALIESIAGAGGAARTTPEINKLSRSACRLW
jgi:hypothetical protein